MFMANEKSKFRERLRIQLKLVCPLVTRTVWLDWPNTDHSVTMSW
jgi:hypothetical protein